MVAQLLAKAAGSQESLSLVGANGDTLLSFWHRLSALGIESKQSRSHLSVDNLSGCLTLLTASD